MLIAVAVFGCFIIALGIVALAAPAALVRFVERFWATPNGMYWAIGFRLVLGCLLFFAAPESRFPRTLQVLSVIIVAAAIGVAALGYLRLAQFIQWWADQPKWVVQSMGLLAVLLGAFLVYASVDGRYRTPQPAMPIAGSIAPCEPESYTQPLTSGAAAGTEFTWPMTSFLYVRYALYHCRSSHATLLCGSGPGGNEYQDWCGG